MLREACLLRPTEVTQAVVKSRESVALERGQQSLRTQTDMAGLNGKGRQSWERQTFFELELERKN